MKQQRTYGIVLVVVSILIVLIAAQGTMLEERDITAALWFLPLGIYMLCTKTPVTYQAQLEASEQQIKGEGEL